VLPHTRPGRGQPSVAPDTEAAPQGPPPASGGSGSPADAQAQVEAESGSASAGGQAHVAAETGAQPGAGATVDESGAQSVEAGSGAAPQGGPTNVGNVKAGGWTEVESSGETNVESRGEAERDDHSVVPRRGGAEGRADGAGFTDVDVNMREDGPRGSRATVHVKASRKLEAAIGARHPGGARDRAEGAGSGRGPPRVGRHVAEWRLGADRQCRPRVGRQQHERVSGPRAALHGLPASPGVGVRGRGLGGGHRAPSSHASRAPLTPGGHFAGGLGVQAGA
jgi:hypothetical protein